MPKTRLPASIRAFSEAQRTIAVERITKSAESSVFPYSDYWKRAVAAMLLSGRVKPKNDGSPNRTDVNRICKEANFNQHLFERFGRFLVHANIIEPTRSRQYQAGQHATGFWNRDVETMREASRRAFLAFVTPHTAYRVWRPTAATVSHLDAFFGAFAQAFKGKALRQDTLGEVFAQFGRLPQGDLHRLAKRITPEIDECECDWTSWLDKPGQEALLMAIYLCHWAYGATYRKQDWIYVSDVARIMLGLQRPPSRERGPTELHVLPNLCVLAGSDLPPEKLVPLFRACKIKRIDRVLEFQLNKRRLAETPASGNAASQLRAILKELEPLPATVESLLGTRPTTGKVRIRGCSALVKPEDAEVLDAIRKHRRLKGYLEGGAPPGYLLIRSNSDPHNFVRRCQELGFRVESL